MWFKRDKYKAIRKTPIHDMIVAYGKDEDCLLDFALSVGKPRIEDIDLADIKTFYKSLDDVVGGFYMQNHWMIKIRKFFRHYRGENVLKADLIRDNPLLYVENIAIIRPMPKEQIKKRGPGRPRDITSIKKVVALRKEGISFRQIALVLKKDLSQVFVWWRDREVLLS